MKKFLSVFVCLLFAVTVLASGYDQGNYDMPAISPTESQPISKILKDLSSYEKSNAVIDIECNEENRTQADIIVEKWNKGDYEEAIELLKSSTELENAALGIQWKDPVRTPRTRWAGDVRVGTVDSIRDIDFDVDNSNGNLFAALLYNFDGTYYSYTINMSSDTGKTWTETYLWTANPSLEIDIDGAVFNGYFYLAYTYANNSLGRIRRFSTSDGSADMTFGTGGYATVIDEGEDLRELVLTSNADNPSPEYLFYFSIMENDSIRCYYSNEAVTAWYPFNPDIDNASRGLDACCAVPNKLWASYIGTDNELYFMGGWSSWTTYPTSADLGSNSWYVTSISAYGDTVIIVYPFPTLPTYDVRYYITTNNGSNWAVGTLLNASDVASWVNDVTARGGDGIGAVYQTTGLSAEGFYKHRSYSSALWTPDVSFADSVTRANRKPCIERIADGIYGILYVNYPEEMAWFDRSDWLTPDGLSLSPDGQTIEFGDTLELTAYLEKDASGVEGEELTFAVTGDGSLDPTSGVTDLSGEVHTEFVAGSTEEVVTVEVTWVSINLLDTLSATVDIEVVNPNPDGLTLSPDGETIEFGQTLDLTAYLEKDGSGFEGEELAFAVITGDGSLDPTTGVTDGSGEVHTEFTAGNTEETVTVEVMWVSADLVDTLSSTVDIEVVAGGIEEIPAVSGISAKFGSGEILCAVAKEGEFTVKVYDKLGREAGTLLSGKVDQGYYPLSLKNLYLATDIYFVVMKGPETDIKIKVALIE